MDDGKNSLLIHLEPGELSALMLAFGDMDDVNRLVCALYSEDHSERDDAMYETVDFLCHQGTVYSHTASAVPTLYRAFSKIESDWKNEIAHLLAYIANGNGFLEVHAPGSPARSVWHNILEKQGKDFDAELFKERQFVKDVRDAISIHLPLLVPYLYDKTQDVRLLMASALRYYPEHQVISLTALETARLQETDEDVLAEIQDSIKHLSSLS